jgi:predicted nuclease with TOPRIM domain
MAGRECAGCGGWVTMHEDQATWKELTDKLAEYERQINDYKKIIHENAASVFGQENKRLNGEVVELRNRLAECEQRNMAYEI